MALLGFAFTSLYVVLHGKGHSRIPVKAFILREGESEDKVHSIFDLDVFSYFQSQETVLHNLRLQ